MTAASEDPQVPDNPADAEWPPREWREARRGAGTKSMYRMLAMIAVIMVVLVVVSFWGMANG